MLQVLMILSHVVRKYDFELVPGQTIEERAMVILRPKHGIRMNFTRAAARRPLSNTSWTDHDAGHALSESAIR
jgi:hypothetical protein